MTELASFARDDGAPHRAESDDAAALLPAAAAGERAPPSSVGTRLLRALGRLRRLAHEEPLLVQTLGGAHAQHRTACSVLCLAFRAFRVRRSASRAFRALFTLTPRARCCDGGRARLRNQQRKPQTYTVCAPWGPYDVRVTLSPQPPRSFAPAKCGMAALAAAVAGESTDAETHGASDDAKDTPLSPEPKRALVVHRARDGRRGRRAAGRMRRCTGCTGRASRHHLFHRLHTDFPRPSGRRTPLDAPEPTERD